MAGCFFIAEAVYAVESHAVERNGHTYPAAEFQGGAYVHERWLPHQLEGNFAVPFPQEVAPEEFEEVPK